MLGVGGITPCSMSFTSCFRVSVVWVDLVPTLLEGGGG